LGWKVDVDYLPERLLGAMEIPHHHRELMITLVAFEPIVVRLEL
jgi:hypothetical protein